MRLVEYNTAAESLGRSRRRYLCGTTRWLVKW
jgi:hypothetical protein